MPSRSKTGLMLVDNPKLFIRSFCILDDQTFTAQDYWHILSSIMGKDLVDEKTRDTYFYSASIFKLIKEVDRRSHVYRITSLAKKICSVLDDKSKTATYRRYLKSLLLTNSDKGPLFKKFVKYTAKPRSRTEIRRLFGEVPSKTLIAFCLETGLSVEHGGLIRSVKAKSSVRIPELYSALVRVYDDLRGNPERAPNAPYVPIDLVRDHVCLELGLEDGRIFDTLLGKIMKSPFGNTLYLHGAPPQAEFDFVGFRYQNKRFAYISLRGSI